MIQFLFYENNPEKVPNIFEKTDKGHYVGNFKKLSDNDIKNLKKMFPTGIFRLVFWEQGGFKWDAEENKAQIVCDTDAFPLVPIYVKNPKKENIGNKQHALFISYNSICTIVATKTKMSTKIKITKHTIDKETGENHKYIIWEGNTRELANLPKELNDFRKPIHYAIEKVNYAGCTKAYYYAK